jgi:uroporphyrinogen decarboxylase
MLVGGEPAKWRSETLADGTVLELPDGFRPERLPDGSEVVRGESGIVELSRPAAGLYFEPVNVVLANATSVRDIERELKRIETFDTPGWLDKPNEELSKTASALRATGEYVLVGYFGGHILQLGQILRGWEEFLLDLLVNKAFAQALMEAAVDANIRRFQRYTETIGRYVDVILFEEDLGMQDRPLLSPELYRSMVKPHHARLYGFAKANSGARLMLHSDGAIAPLIPDFIEMGIDILTPVQVSAAGMDTARLKKDFGRDLCFWGAACDSQTTLPFGTPNQVADEARRRIGDLAPGGGFVFAPIHNIQAGVPAANIAAMYRAAREHGAYR